MGKQGPCGHCGIATTPLWRNGPPEKPVLCNACGSRWRTKGTLSNYMPMHSGGFGGAVCPEGGVIPRGRKNRKPFSEPRSHKRKEPSEGHQERASLRSHMRSFKAGGDDSISTSSLSSSVSGLEDATFITSSSAHPDGAASSPLWEGHIPTRKRTSMSRVCASVDKLSKQFQETLCDFPAASSTLMHGFPDDILVDSKPSTMADEIGLGSVFIRQAALDDHKSESHLMPNSAEEGLFETRVHRHGGPLQQLLNGAESLPSVRGKEKAKECKKVDNGVREHLNPNNTLLENYPYNKRDVLQSCQSPLVFLELKDILNFDTFTGLLTDQEQGQLMRYLSSEDVAKGAESLKQMITSAEFDGSLANFQQLLEEGMFESSMLGVHSRILQHFQQLLNITDLASSGWMEQFLQLQSRSRRRGGSAEVNKSKEVNKEKAKGHGLQYITKGAPPSNKQSPGRFMSQSGVGVQEETSIHTGGKKNGGLASSGTVGGVVTGRAPEAVNFVQDIGNSSNDKASGFEAGGACFTSNSLLSAEQMCGGVSSISANDLPDLQAPGSDETEADLLFTMPTNMMTFQDTVLLQQPAWSKIKENDTYQVEMGSPLTSNMWHMDSAPSELFWNPTCAGAGHGLLGA